MKGNRFEGLSDDQWQILKIFLPREPEKRGKGKPHTPWREVCNSLLWILINGARWCDLPKGDQWASRSASQGKGVITHLLIDGNGNPINFEVTSAKGDERQQVEKLLDGIEEFTNHRYLLHGLIPIFEADKGYDAEELRDKLLKRRIFPFIPYRRIGAVKKAEKIVCNLAKFRWKVERAISWLQRKFRRLVVRWERRLCYWKGFLTFSLIFFWVDRLKILSG